MKSPGSVVIVTASSSSAKSSAPAPVARRPRREATVTSSSAVRHVVAPRRAQAPAAAVGRDALEKQRLEQRTGGFHQRAYDSAQPVGTAGVDDRFGHDFAAEEAERRRAALRRKQDIYSAQRETGLRREERVGGGGMQAALTQLGVDPSNRAQPQYGRRAGESREASRETSREAPQTDQPRYGRRAASSGGGPSSITFG